MPSILDEIVARKRDEIAAAKWAIPESELRRRIDETPPPRDFFQALSAPGPIKLIAEIKRASPSKGVLRADFRPLDIAEIYEQHGASCISVLTDAHYFQGSLEILADVRRHISIPVLRKDFILDAYQLLEARAAGADAVLLIAECLDDCHLRALHNEAIEWGLTPLVELYEPANLPRVLDAGATLIGINNRDLRSFETSLDHTLRLRQQVPDGCLLVSESGIRNRADVVRLEAAGVDAILVGESLMSSADVAAAVDALLGNGPA